jgi:hypothetical protein
MKRLLAILAFLLAPALSHAELITINFAGHLSTIGAFGNDFGLGVHVGDAFSGSFSYDSDALPISVSTIGPPSGLYMPLSFTVQFPGVTVVGSSLKMQIQLMDIRLTFFNIQGIIPGGFYMNVGLTNGKEVLDSVSPPTSLDCADWLLCGLQIKASSFPAIEIGWLEPDSIRALNGLTNAHPEIFSFIPPPPPKFPSRRPGCCWGWEWLL